MRQLLFSFLFLINVQQVVACDICGCSSGNYFLGPTPQFSKHFIGIRYSFRSFHTILKEDENEYSKDFYQTTELWTGWKIKNKFQLLAFVPYNSNQQTTDEGTNHNIGFGDITAIGSYKIFDKKNLTKDTLTVGQQLWFGVGIKLPTGHFAIDTAELVSSANSQAGTGSFDFLLTAFYNIIIDNWGFTSNINCKINQSASDFKFGNRFTATAFGFRSFHKGKNSFNPNIGLLYENLNPSEFAKEKIEGTGGYALLAAAGLETRFDKVTIGFNVQSPLLQNISDGQTKINLRGMLHLTYAF